MFIPVPCGKVIRKEESRNYRYLNYPNFYWKRSCWYKYIQYPLLRIQQNGEYFSSDICSDLIFVSKFSIIIIIIPRHHQNDYASRRLLVHNHHNLKSRNQDKSRDTHPPSIAINNSSICNMLNVRFRNTTTYITISDLGAIM